MAARQSKGQKATVERVMHEYKKGELEAGKSGRTVKSRKQAIAIALSESGTSNRQSPRTNRKRLATTKSKERRGKTAEAQKEGKRAQDRTLAKGRNGGRTTASSTTKAELYARAKKADIAGRSSMSKAQLQRALAH